MPFIVAYQKSSDQYTTYSLDAPEGSTELCTLDGLTYVSMPKGSELAPQSEMIAGSVRVAVVDDELRKRLCAASPHVALIQQRVREKIAALYSVHDEIKLLRTAPSPEFEAYNEHAEACRQWGREQKTALGLLV